MFDKGGITINITSQAYLMKCDLTRLTQSYLRLLKLVRDWSARTSCGKYQNNLYVTSAFYGSYLIEHSLCP